MAEAIVRTHRLCIGPAEGVVAARISSSRSGFLHACNLREGRIWIFVSAVDDVRAGRILLSSQTAIAKMLVIGYGNALRGDDGAGVWAAETIAPGIRISVVPPSPNSPPIVPGQFPVTTTLSSSTRAIAWPTCSGDWCRRIRIGRSPLAPGALIGLAIDLHDRCAEIWLPLKFPRVNISTAKSSRI